ncbi:heme-binding protein [Deefgea tanakiae]|uniref:Heme-binding protein n=1 Tax=Deefgea tanakiae TaxID=2865840 RepID=A0ABX8Z9T0_9NEIS|nr:heme-binding protein [Deefgea tanakiae]QZA77910.1 heme-binding protein [Deefgea tanakiae]
MKQPIQLILMLAFGLVGAPAMATEEPKFEVISQNNNFELRRYPAILVAEVEVAGDMDTASGQGFRAIADFIFGNNVAVNLSSEEGSEKIAMTVPVTLTPVKASAQKIAMTAPVVLAPSNASAPSDIPALQGAQQWRVHFVMPSSYTLATLPKPNNPAVVIRELPAKTWAVLKYSGFNTEAGTQKRIDELRAWMASQNLKAVGSPQLARYNPPWTLPVLRRNEVMFEVE